MFCLKYSANITFLYLFNVVLGALWSNYTERLMAVVQVRELILQRNISIMAEREQYIWFMNMRVFDLKATNVNDPQFIDRSLKIVVSSAGSFNLSTIWGKKKLTGSILLIPVIWSNLFVQTFWDQILACPNKVWKFIMSNVSVIYFIFRTSMMIQKWVFRSK